VKPTFDSFTEPTVDRRKLLFGMLFCAASGVAAWRLPRKHLDYLGKDTLEQLVPKSIGRWNFVAASGLVVPPQDELRDATYSQLLTRVYSDGRSPPVMFLIAQSANQTGILQVHRPEFCYTASGYKISPVVPRPIDLGSSVLHASAMDATSGGTPEHVVYWTRVGDRIPTSWTQQKLDVAELNLKGLIPDAVLVRVSCVTSDSDVARSTIDNFVRTFVASVPPSRRSVFIASI
jgi:EpsI family protein